MDMPFTKSLIKKEIRNIMDSCDKNPELDFLEHFGKLRTKVLYTGKYLTDEQFDDACQEVLDEIEKEEKA